MICLDCKNYVREKESHTIKAGDILEVSVKKGWCRALMIKVPEEKLPRSIHNPIYPVPKITDCTAFEGQYVTSKLDSNEYDDLVESFERAQDDLQPAQGRFVEVEVQFEPEHMESVEFGKDGVVHVNGSVMEIVFCNMRFVPGVDFDQSGRTIKWKNPAFRPDMIPDVAVKYSEK